MLLAEKLLEGYGEFYTSVEESDIVDPIAYLNEVCIEAITALQEAAQQYYIGDIIGQSEVLMEGCTEEALMESIGSKAKELWGKFVKKVKEIIDKLIAKINKFIGWVKSKKSELISRLQKLKDKLKNMKSTHNKDEEEWEGKQSWPDVKGMRECWSDYAYFHIKHFIYDYHLGRVDLEKIFGTMFDLLALARVYEEEGKTGDEYLSNERYSNQNKNVDFEKSFPIFCKDATGMDPETIYKKMDSFLHEIKNMPDTTNSNRCSFKDMDDLIEDVNDALTSLDGTVALDQKYLSLLKSLKTNISSPNIENTDLSDSTIQSIISNISKQISFITALLNHDIQGIQYNQTICTTIITKLQ